MTEANPIPRQHLHRAVDELHRVSALAFGPALAAAGGTPDHLARVVRMVVLRALAAEWCGVVPALGSHDVASIRRAALEGFVALEQTFERALAIEPCDRQLLAVADVGASASRVDVPAPADATQIAAFLGAAYEALLSSRACAVDGVVGLAAGVERRRSGAHHTEPRVARDVVARALSPLLPQARRRVEAPLLICDPAMGSGAFLVEAARFLAAELGGRPGDWVVPCLHGTDSDPVAVDLARLALYCLAVKDADAARPLRAALVRADFVVRPDATSFGVSTEAPALDPRSMFPSVHDSGGFDAIIGNPPWVAFKGRATQPIAPALASYFKETCAAFGGYVTLHGVFVERAVQLLRPGGRLGLVVPTSMADLDGYAPTRRAHDRASVADTGLPDYGADAFEGVFQPAMAILSTRRDGPVASSGEPWDLARSDQDSTIVAFLDRLARAPLVPEACFGERGFQTSGSERSRLARQPDERRDTPLRCGADITPFQTLPPTYWVDRGELRTVDHCSLDIEAGEICMIVGPSGCGKTTLLNAIAGFHEITSGTITLDGEVLCSTEKPKAEPGSDRIVVFQNGALFPWKTNLENIAFGPIMQGKLPKAEAKEKALSMMADAGLSGVEHNYPGEVSSGMRRRVEIVRALMNDPKVLLLDEPYRALDSLTKSVMHEALLEIYYKNKVTIFFITHDLEEAVFLGHKVAIMTSRPCKPKKILNVDIPHPRDYSVLTSKRFRELIEETNEAVHEEALKAFQAGEKEG